MPGQYGQIAAFKAKLNHLDPRHFLLIGTKLRIPAASARPQRVKTQPAAYRTQSVASVPALIDYWAARRRKVLPPLDSYNLRLLAKQDGRCPLCGDHILSPDQPPQSPHAWERWWLGIIKRAIAADYLTHHGRGGTPDGNRTRLIHTSCHRSLQARRRRRPELATPSRLA